MANQASDELELELNEDVELIDYQSNQNKSRSRSNSTTKRSRKHRSTSNHSQSPSRRRPSSPIMNDFPSLREEVSHDKYELNSQIINKNEKNRVSNSPSSNPNSIYFLPGDDELEDRNHQQYISPSAYGHPFPRNSHLQSQSQTQDQGLLPLNRAAANANGNGRRRRNDSYSSIGSSVAPAGLHARGVSHNNPNSNTSTSTTNQRFRPSGSKRDLSTSSIGAAGGGGLENWLKSQGGGGSSSTTNGGENAINSAAPSGRIRRMGGNGSDAGSAISGWSQGGLSGSGRRKVKRQASNNGEKLVGSNTRRPLPTFESEEPDDSLDSIQQWRETSAVVSSSSKGEDPSTWTLSSSRSKSESLSSKSRGKVREKEFQPINSKNHLSSSTPLIVTSPGGRRSTAGPPSSKGGRSSSRISNSTYIPPPPLPINFKYDQLSGSQSSQNSTPIRRAVRWLAKLDGKDNNSRITTTTILLTCIFIKWCVGMSGWSGRGNSPMFGDFEAQRHWMELTLHLPTSKWYYYDLQYWGLDYPPLTAWISWLCAKVGVSLFGLDSSFDLDSSRGSESPELSVFMRFSVLFFDLLIYIPSIMFFLSRKLEGRGRRTKAIALATILLQPSTILIDNGHFQYNSIMLGLSALCFGYLNTSLPNPDLHLQQSSSSAGNFINEKSSKEEKERKTRFETVTNLSRGVSYEYVLAAISFSYSLGFKQMALFYAPAVFAIMLGRCWGLAITGAERGLALFSGLGLSVIISFIIMLWPWLGSISSLGQILHRVFPLARGIFEDKVSNFWCFISVLPLPSDYKLKNLLSSNSLARLSLIVTLIFILPPCVHLFRSSKQTVIVEMNLANDFRSRNEVLNNKILKSGSTTSLMSLNSKKDSNNINKRSGSPDTIRSHNKGVLSRNQIEDNQENQVLTASSRSIQGERSNSNVIPRRTRAPSAAASEAGSELIALLNVTRNDTSLPTSSSSLRFDLSDQQISKSKESYSNNSNSIQRPIASSTPSPSALLLPYGLLSISFTFFLFGFQTHEKSILIPLLPLTLLMGAKGDDWGGGANEVDWEWAVLGNNVAVFSMWPLLQRDGLGFQYTLLVFFWNWTIGHRPFSDLKDARKTFVAWIGALIHLSILSLHLLEILIPILSPSIHSRIISRFPDLFPVLNVLLTTPCFILIWLWSLKRQLEVGYAAGLEGVGLWILAAGGGGKKSAKKDKENGNSKMKSSKEKEEKNV